MDKKAEADALRELVDRMRELEADPDYDPSEALQSLIAEKDPELATLIEDFSTVSSQAELGKRRLRGEPIPGTEFEKRRDRQTILKEAKLVWKLNKKLHDR